MQELKDDPYLDELESEARIIGDKLLAKDEGWRPNLKQEPFLQLPITIKEAFYGGGAGSGKSDVLLYYALVWGWYLNPRFKQVFMRRTFPELRNEIVPRSREIYRRFGATFNKSDMAWTFPRIDQHGGTGLTNDGAIIFLGHCENEEDVHKYDSMEINLYTPDELTSFTRDMYEYIGLQRVRSSDPGLPEIIRAAGMPGGVGHTWVNQRFVKPYPLGGKILVGRAGLKRIFIHATQADNPHGSKTYQFSLAAISNEAERKAKLYGDFDAYLGQVFDEFRDKPYTGEPANAQHVVPAFQIPSYWPRMMVGDWGMRAMTYILYAAISPEKRIYIYREQYWRQVKIEEWAPYVKVFLDKENIKTVLFCRSTAQDRGQEHTIQQQIEDALGIGIELSANTPGSRVAGKALLHEYLRWKERPVVNGERPAFDSDFAQKLYTGVDRMAYHKYMAMFAKEEREANLPKMQILDCCPVLVSTLKSCSYAKSSKEGVPAEDVAEFDGDDPYDTCRYLVDRADRYFVESTEKFHAMLQQEKLAMDLIKDQDYTKFYMQARALEAQRKHSAFRGVRRFH